MMVHQTATHLNSWSTAPCDPRRTPESAKSSMLWCSVDSICPTGLTFGRLQIVGGAHLPSDQSCQDQCSVSMSVWLYFAIARQLVKLPATVHSIARSSELLLNCLQLEDLGLFHPIGVKLWIMRDIVNSGILAAFLCVHYWPFQHTCVIYWHDLQYTSLTTASNCKLGNKKHKIAPCIVSRCTGECIIISRLIHKESLSWWVGSVMFVILCWFVDKHWQKYLSQQLENQRIHPGIEWPFIIALSKKVVIILRVS